MSRPVQQPERGLSMGEVRAPATRLYARVGQHYGAFGGVSRNKGRVWEPSASLLLIGWLLRLTGGRCVLLVGRCVAVTGAPTDAGVDEVINVAIQYGRSVAHFVFGPQILDHLVGVQHVGAHLVAP